VTLHEPPLARLARVLPGAVVEHRIGIHPGSRYVVLRPASGSTRQVLAAAETCREAVERACDLWGAR
jgi:hypothetical protein